ncbi:DNA-binding transcriptional dual regulator; Helix-turn-helix, AraC type [Nitrospirillum viridazoti Y2]|uniref:AraC-like DNA-binding protein n=1 Tax=Nitrospirillum amazonense TaxID=28077 RepID=A0A560J1Y7_9PROT|nr:AraC family transcriptional regulator [Nitrospirillum amazonense]EGY01974.1 DNA-binding transcriptional dual regulator; Helix-turn-helix, AraC type [Nitrospirillum amazonense Y2]TWB64439.1 AraC-like DNA-binding protein [Nitrospirillum amazonense]
MATIRAQIASVFAANPIHGLRGGTGWHVDSVLRDIATIHHLTSDAFAFSLDEAKAFDGPGFCAHIIFLRTGQLSMVQPGHSRTLTPGDIFVACAWRPMTLEGTDDLDALIITLPAWWAMRRFLDGLAILPDLHIGTDYFAAPIIATLAGTLFDLPNGDAVSAAQGLAMIADLMRTALAAGIDTAKALPRWQGRIGEILEFIIRNLDTPGISAHDAAASLKCSVRTIYKTCAAQGTSFNAFLNEIRLVTAQYQLMNTTDRVSEIAYSVGFSSLSHFAHLFRARFGVSAKAMRQGRSTYLPH